jgi:outer membrane receptor protein involved in Fe transport
MKFLIPFFSVLLLTEACLAQKDSTSSDSARMLSPVTVQGRVSVKALKQQPFNIAVIDAAPYYSSNITGVDLLRQASGIKIKQNGGFGSSNDFFINGSSGKQVKFFIDGLPQDNLGETQLLNIYPVEQIERLEVYKGVLPVELGADALGGAINIVTRKEREDYINASYSIASFNTHKLNVLGKKYITDHFFTSLQANFNYAGNDYPVQGEIIKPNGQADTMNVPLFHDLFKNYNVRFQAGYTGKPFADHLTFTLLQTGMHDQLQHSLMMLQPYGYVYRNEKLQSIILRYQKANLLPKTDIAAMFSYNRVSSMLMDTSRYSFLWNGEVARDLNGQPQRKLSGGELSSSGHELYAYTHLLNGKLTAVYKLSDQAKLVFSNTFQRYRRTGRDPVAQKFYGGIDYYSTPSEMIKNVAGIGLEGKLRETKWRYLASLKHYYTSVKGFEIVDLNRKTSQKKLAKPAWNAGLGYQWNENLLLKLSYEHAARLPEPEEAFGDFTYVTANPNIEAERSKNLNLTVMYNTNRLEAELTGFYRDVKDLIYLPPSQFYSRYDNLLSLRIIGMEGNVKYRVWKNITVNGNFTYQDMRNQSNISDRPIDNGRYKNSRMPNIPYLFANGSIAYGVRDIFKAGNSLQLWYNVNYTHEYFLYWAEDGDRELKNLLPMQLLHGAGISFSLYEGLSLAFEATNITNARTYDNFKVQLPGRAFSFKIRFYQFNKK